MLPDKQEFDGVICKVIQVDLRKLNCIHFSHL